MNGCSCRACNGIYNASNTFGYTNTPEGIKPLRKAQEDAYEIPEKSVHDRIGSLPDRLHQMDKLEVLIECNKLATEVDTIDEELHKIQKELAKMGCGDLALRLGKLSQRLN